MGPPSPESLEAARLKMKQLERKMLCNTEEALKWLLDEYKIKLQADAKDFYVEGLHHTMQSINAIMRVRTIVGKRIADLDPPFTSLPESMQCSECKRIVYRNYGYMQAGVFRCGEC